MVGVVHWEHRFKRGRPSISRRRWLGQLAAPAAAAALAACCTRARRSVVIYTALDQVFSEPLFEPFERQTGVRVLAVYDTEAVKTVGLFNRIRLEADSGRVRCDVFWNNEILNTLRLHRLGLLRPLHPANAEPFPEQFKAADGTWYGFAARARVLLVNTEQVAEPEQPSSMFELAEPRWRGKLAMAKPLFGTTATHAACLFAALGPERARHWFKQLKDNQVRIMPGNKQSALAVSDGTVALGLTDTDDAVIEVEKGRPVRIVYLDSEPDQLGTLFLPNTVCSLAGCPHPAEADLLVNYLLSPQVEVALATGPSAQIPLNPNVKVQARVATPKTVKPMDVDFAAALDHWDQAMKYMAELFETG